MRRVLGLVAVFVAVLFFLSGGEARAEDPPVDLSKARIFKFGGSWTWETDKKEVTVRAFSAFGVWGNQYAGKLVKEKGPDWVKCVTRGEGDKAWDYVKGSRVTCRALREPTDMVKGETVSLTFGSKAGIVEIKAKILPSLYYMRKRVKATDDTAKQALALAQKNEKRLDNGEGGGKGIGIRLRPRVGHSFYNTGHDGIVTGGQVLYRVLSHGLFELAVGVEIWHHSYKMKLYGSNLAWNKVDVKLTEAYALLEAALNHRYVRAYGQFKLGYGNLVHGSKVAVQDRQLLIRGVAGSKSDHFMVGLEAGLMIYPWRVFGIGVAVGVHWPVSPERVEFGSADPDYEPSFGNRPVAFAMGQVELRF